MKTLLESLLRRLRDSGITVPDSLKGPGQSALRARWTSVAKERLATAGRDGKFAAYVNRPDTTLDEVRAFIDAREATRAKYSLTRPVNWIQSPGLWVTNSNLQASLQASSLSTLAPPSIIRGNNQQSQAAIRAYRMLTTRKLAAAGYTILAGKAIPAAIEAAYDKEDPDLAAPINGLSGSKKAHTPPTQSVISNTEKVSESKSEDPARKTPPGDKQSADKTTGSPSPEQTSVPFALSRIQQGALIGAGAGALGSTFVNSQDDDITTKERVKHLLIWSLAGGIAGGWVGSRAQDRVDAGR